MGVDYSAFIAYGSKIEHCYNNEPDEMFNWLNRQGKDLDLALVEWGAISYTNEGGYIVGDRRCTRSINVDGGADCLAIDNPPSDVASRILNAVRRGAPFKVIGPVGWWFGVHVF